MTKKLPKEVKTRSRFRKKYDKNHTYKNWLNYKKQLNDCTNIPKKVKTDSCSKIDIRK